VVNVSHGCINVSAQNAQAYFESDLRRPRRGHRQQRASVEAVLEKALITGR
jgi:hypothetical protein